MKEVVSGMIERKKVITSFCTPPASCSTKEGGAMMYVVRGRERKVISKSSYVGIGNRNGLSIVDC